MKTTYNEFGFSLVIGKGNWVGLSYEFEDGDYEIRKLGWKKLEKIRDIYFRGQIMKKMIVISNKNGFIIKNKNKYGLKAMIGFSDRK
ncbi:MAG: hypothetical protein WC850_04940 [Candidatus Gracilibacteria bacterium]